MCICTNRDCIVGQKWQITGKLEYRLSQSPQRDTVPFEIMKFCLVKYT